MSLNRSRKKRSSRIRSRSTSKAKRTRKSSKSSSPDPYSFLKDCGFSNPRIKQQYESDDHGFPFKPFKFSQSGKSYIAKARSAILDKEILELFRGINLVNDKSGGSILPYLNISVCGNNSVWDFIEGDLIFDKYGTLNSYSTAEEVSWEGFKKVVVKHPERIKNIEYLNTVCSLIGLTDLHTENVILQDNMYYLIDLEVLDHGKATGLYGMTSKGPINKSLLNKAAMNLINDFNKRSKELMIRYLPIDTNLLTEYLLGKNGVSIDTLIHVFFKDKRSRKVDRSDLIFYLKKCYKKKIVPYFVIEKGIISYYNFTKKKYEKFLGQ